MVRVYASRRICTYAASFSMGGKGWQKGTPGLFGNMAFHYSDPFDKGLGSRFAGFLPSSDCELVAIRPLLLSLPEQTNEGLLALRFPDRFYKRYSLRISYNAADSFPIRSGT